MKLIIYALHFLINITKTMVHIILYKKGCEKIKTMIV